MKKFASAWLLIMMLMAITIPVATVQAAGTIYYVDSSGGNDSNSGTSTSAAWQTLTKVNSITFQPGDQILFKAGGSWSGMLSPLGSGNSTNQITIDMYGTGNKPLIAGGGVAASVLLNGQEYWTINNLELTNIAASRAVRSGIKVVAKTTGITHGIHIANNNIHDVTGENRRSMPAGQSMYDNSGILIRFDGDATPTDMFDDVLIENNNIHDVLTSGIKVDSTGGTTADQLFTNVVVRNNIISKTGSDGTVIGSTLNALIEHNSVYDAGYNGNQADTHLIAGMWEIISKNTVFQYNEVARTKLFDADGTGFDTDLGTGGTIYFQYNYTHGNEGGFWLDCAHITPNGYIKTVLRYNVSVDDLGYIARTDDRPADFYNNTFYKSSGSLDASQGADGSSYRFWNNIFNFQTSPNWASSLYDNNLYYPEAANSADGNAVTGDPAFVNPGVVGDGMSYADNYKLQSTSAAIDKGIPTADNGGVDFWGSTLYNLMPDIGAQEYGTNGTYDANTTNKFSLDFSTTQGQKNWNYMQYNGSTYSNMTWNSSLNAWKGAGTWNRIWSAGVLHPDTNDTVLAWKAPKAGQVRITGKPRKAGTGGDGVNVKLMQNSTQLWPASGWQAIGASDISGVAHDVTINVAANDMIYFIVNKNSTTNNDATNWDPMVRYASTLSNDFSTTQGSGYWSYMESNGRAFSNMTWNASINAWKGTYTYNRIWTPTQIHPDINDSVVAWTAPVAGSVRITGNPKKGNSGGDGVNVKIMKNGTQIWPASGWQYISGTDTVGVTHDITTSVAANDMIYFIVNKNGNINVDETTWNPTVAFQ
ncbi:hypothetical protein QFZ77_006034 [Paenibacillus sp. V4I3]|uniref:right-handed parallel beta-helix repeat-containing protein n=1 Tax=unclassified Paenibacillus TaxID=185978 RepID=UPI00278726D5|nr:MULTISPECIES: right-handed parallel beta-helix repeat-containing protein [unclassified Paenibacillus]MDQ0877375.1 hypothetical protein [Paenibacillus sp. V4I3]MDQ0886760.1 hypothetical protein [Paenibacillus sp. V4I9]